MSDFPSPCYLHHLMGIHFLPTVRGVASASMKVEEKLCQPLGFLSGGASLALAETLAGQASLELCSGGEFPFGIQVSATHLQAVALGHEVTATARLLQKSPHLHVWNVEITDEKGGLISVCRVTNYIKTRTQHDSATVDHH